MWKVFLSVADDIAVQETQLLLGWGRPYWLSLTLKVIHLSVSD